MNSGFTRNASSCSPLEAQILVILGSLSSSAFAKVLYAFIDSHTSRALLAGLTTFAPVILIFNCAMYNDVPVTCMFPLSNHMIYASAKMPSMVSNLPAPSFLPVLTYHVAIDIDAPIDKVWAILVDFPRYPEWNPFVYVESHGRFLGLLIHRNLARRSAVIVDKNKKALDDQTPAKGKHIYLKTHTPLAIEASSKTSVSTYSEILMLFNAPAHRLSWRFLGPPSWLLKTEYSQALSTKDDGRTVYEAREVWGGICAYLIKWFKDGKALKQGSEAVAECLRARSERI